MDRQSKHIPTCLPIVALSHSALGKWEAGSLCQKKTYKILKIISSRSIQHLRGLVLFFNPSPFVPPIESLFHHGFWYVCSNPTTLALSIASHNFDLTQFLFLGTILTLPNNSFVSKSLAPDKFDPLLPSAISIHVSEAYASVLPLAISTFDACYNTF